MDKSYSKREKILILFILGIGLPSLILGYLAFRGIQNDRAILEKERLKEHRQIGLQVIETISDSIKKVELNLLEAITGYQNSSVKDFIDGIKYKYPVIEEVFIIENDGDAVFPSADLPYHLNLSIQNYTPGNTRLDNLEAIRTAHQLEFQHKKYKEALRYYRQALNSVSSPELRGEILNNIARVQKNASHNRNAIKTYQTIIRDYSQCRSKNGLVLPLTARLELGSLYFTLADTLKAFQAYLKAYQGLVHGNYDLDGSQFEFYRRKILEGFAQMGSSVSLDRRFHEQIQQRNSLNREYEELERFTVRLNTFQEHFTADYRDRISAGLEDSLYAWKRFDLERNGNIFYGAVLSRPVEKKYWGILVRQSYLKDKLLLPVLSHRIQSKQIGWIVKNETGEVILRKGPDHLNSITIQTNFKDNFPPWVLAFYQTVDDSFNKFLLSGRSVYFYMFLLIGGILLSGFLLSIRTVTHELELAKMKSDFVSTISHEFKSPLTSIRQISEMLKYRRVPSEKRREKYYDILIDQSDRLSLLINNILDISKLEEGKRKFQYELVHIQDLLQESVRTMQHRIRHEGFSINVKVEKELPAVKMDKSAISQVLYNLLDNAIKFSGARKEVNVKGFSDGDHVNIAVQDFGRGIEYRELDKIFERFYRGGDELNRTVKGSGLGLTIVKQIVEAHHGTIEVTSVPENGSTFLIRLPLHTEKRVKEE